MNIAHQVMAWRRFKGLTQAQLARRTGLAQPYISRLESGGLDPTLSTLRRLAVAMDVPMGLLIEEHPPAKSLDRLQLDELARAAIHPGATQGDPAVRALAGLVKDRRQAVGLYKTRKPGLRKSPAGKHAARWLRARLGEEQWRALLKRIDKLVSVYAG